MHSPTVERCQGHRGKPGRLRNSPGGEADMNRNLLRLFGVAAAAASLFSGSVAGANTNQAARLRQVGATSIVYHGPQVEIAMSYRYPKLTPGGTWLMLDTVMVGTRDPIEVPRTAISVRTPSGEVVPLATPTEYNNGYRELAWGIITDDATREPLGLLIARRYLPLRFFPPRGIGLAVDSEWLDNFHNTYGRLFFKLPDGLQNGTYQLLINLSESKVVIPFTI